MNKCGTFGCKHERMPDLTYCLQCGYDRLAAACRESALLAAQSGDPLNYQVGGDHYKKLPIQPAEYVHKNKIPYLEGSVIYYVTRWRDKNGLADIDKAIHTLQLLKELEHGKTKS